ncbi:hypothetical protein SPAR113_0093 [Streptococcus pneumoniae GA49447]|nr:hypothetical protein SPAR113_0093 [Streptococcus pneumoniae GA49447]EHD81735.1 hypothetical protein SPAR144_0048 [Streptococcus pneumoniae NP170]
MSLLDLRGSLCLRIYLHEPLITTVSQDFTSLSDISHF